MITGLWEFGIKKYDRLTRRPRHPLAGRSLIISGGGHPCELVLAGAIKPARKRP
jgi:hypothetical protein